MIKIIVDCFGGDNGVAATVGGAKKALESIADLEIVFTGDKEAVEAEISRTGLKERYSVVHAPDVVGCNEKPTDVVRHKPESSLMKGIDMLRAGEADGMVSTGSTGAIVAAATMRVGRLKGVSRPTFCPIAPTVTGNVVGICDSGANVDVTPTRLCQFAIMGSIYMKNVFGIDNPRVALLNVGTEEEKGDALRKATYPLLANAEGLNFVGNMESREVLSGKYDLIVCDGFSGNVMIKTVEGVGVSLFKKLKKDMMSKLKYKLGALMLKKLFLQEYEFMNYQNYGGSVLLGTKKVIVKGHGSSDETAVAKCIEQAYKMEASKMNEQIESALSSFEE